MKISMACDHAGFELKQHLAELLRKAGHEVLDFGCNSSDPVDFVDHVYPAALALSEARCDRAVLVDGAGYPSGIVANMLPDVFAAVANDPVSARLSREHSDANALCVGGRIEKRRHLVHHGGHLWEVDEFLGDNAGLVVAEIELEAADAPFARPDWLGTEVTDAPRYYNLALASHPFSRWDASERG